jgi:hypothetical protein
MYYLALHKIVGTMMDDEYMMDLIMPDRESRKFVMTK